MESLAYTHLALAYEESSSQDLSNLEVFNLLTKLNFAVLIKQQKCICKAWVYGLSLSLAFVPLTHTLTLDLGKSGEKVNHLASNVNSKITLAKSPNSSSLEGKGGIQPSLIRASEKEYQEKALFAKKSEEGLNQIASANRITNFETASKTKLIQDRENTENKAFVSNSNLQVEPKQVISNKLLVSKSNSSSKTQPEQKGKLRFVNDTPYTGIILLYKPGEQQPYRYAHISPCKIRELYATYSNLGRVSFNSHQVFSIDEASVKKGNFFEIKTSKLAEKDSQSNSCQDANTSQTVTRDSDPNRNRIYLFIPEVNDLDQAEQLHNPNINLLQKSGRLLENITDEMEKISRKMKPLNSVTTDYCYLEKLIKRLKSRYDFQSSVFVINRYVSPIELNGTLENSNNGLTLSGEPIKTTGWVSEFILLTELYLETSQIYRNNLDPSPTQRPPQGQRRFWVNDEQDEQNRCLARLNSGKIQIASAVRKKANIC
ncbi:hypothetical protein [Aerosakkonema funiforme]|uniref:hypothetical protein n=1 Tax=Aerosakkonema funiforme TaxID=1246630 RepID=UPI0035B94DCD